ncbi:uncharacterized protein LOC131648552 [Vicia villosa]|uniref:uncharacterized protein LOC131648552 n=1 Tax=Vicia villosa TaxID=3911 RepID=UPI00273AF934|nr:uncharacterized protein LOC131648552 [Vicia villosa]
MPPRVSPPDIDSPFYIHPSEGPNLVCISPKLNGSNYLAWSKSMQRALGAKNKFSFINGDLAIPSHQDLNRNQWERCNHLIHSWLLNSVSEQIASTIVFHVNAIDVWIDLRERFLKADRIRIFNLHSSINNLKQSSRSVMDYFIELRGLWEELNEHRPISACTCVQQCRCLAMQNTRAYRDEDQVMQFLSGLNDQFSVVKTQVLMMEPLPAINKVYSLVVQEESNHKSVSPNEDENALMVNAANRFEPKELAIQLIFVIKKHGHPNFNKNKAQANASTTQDSDVDHTPASSASPSTDPHANISQAQYDQLIGLLQQINLIPSTNPLVSTLMTDSIHNAEPSGIVCNSFNSSARANYWILDSGANDHVCSSLALFTSIHSITPISITLPNGSSIRVTQAGHVHFSSTLYLEDVLYSNDFISI